MNSVQKLTSFKPLDIKKMLVEMSFGKIAAQKKNKQISNTVT